MTLDNDRIAGELRDFIAGIGAGPVFVHSDPLSTAALVPRARDRGGLLDSHVELLVRIADGRGLWAPAFNYDFPRSRRFDVSNDLCQLGPLPEHFRSQRADWRTHVPIFSVSGIGPDPGVVWGPDTDPFGPASIFRELAARDGVILYYGNTFHYSTIIHYAERQGGGPLYRYDKEFPGTVIVADGSAVTGSLNYHVRPLGAGLDYDWDRLLREAVEAGVCHRSGRYSQVLAASAQGLTRFFREAMNDDPFALLDEKSRSWVIPAYEEAGRRFLIGDFESPVTWG
ncbi:MAG: AAC(3) family N-acetyltransferase [Gemmatimonadaceae bacterium]